MEFDISKMDLNAQEFRRFDLAVNTGDTEVVKMMLKEKHVDVNKENVFKETLFWTACRKGHLAIVKLLLEDPRVDVNRVKSGGVSPFFVACENGHLDVVKTLLENDRIQVHQERWDRCTPFFIACLFGHIEIVKLLLKDPRVDLSTNRLDGLSPLIIASREGNFEVVKWLLASERLENCENLNPCGKKKSIVETFQEAKESKNVRYQEAQDEGSKCQETCLKLLKRFEENPSLVRQEIREELGILSRRACDIFAAIVLYTDEYLDLI